MDNNELQHWGIKGQQWGVRRFQNADGSLTAAGKKRYGEEEDDESKKEVPKPKTKEEVLKSGSAKEILEFKGNITNKEYQDAFTRLDYEKKMASYSQAETKSGLDKFSDVMSKVDQVRVGSQKAIDAYNVIAKVNNAFNPKFKLQEINSGSINSRLKAAEDAREAARKARKAEAAEKDFAKNGDKALGKLTNDELKDLNVRTSTKKQIQDRLKKEDSTGKPKAESASAANKTVDEDHSTTKTVPGTNKKETDREKNNETASAYAVLSSLTEKNSSKKVDKHAISSEEHGKLTQLVDKIASKKISKRTVSPEEQAKLNMKKANQAKAKTKSAISAWVKAGHSVSEIAERLGISESTVRNYLEELK